MKKGIHTPSILQHQRRYCITGISLCLCRHGPLIGEFYCGQRFERSGDTCEPGLLPLANRFVLKGVAREWKAVRRQPIDLGVTSLLGITDFNTFIYIAGYTTSATNRTLIAETFPVFIIIGGHWGTTFFNEHLLAVNLGDGYGICYKKYIR